MGTRRQSRECALQMLYQFDLSADEPEGVIRSYWAVNEADEETRLFANELVRGVVGEISTIDAMLSEYSTNWKITRMAAVDKNILRVAAYELVHRDDIPAKVTINEAVEIAKKFGTADSGAFVNGILDNIAKKIADKGGGGEDAV